MGVYSFDVERYNSLIHKNDLSGAAKYASTSHFADQRMKTVIMNSLNIMKDKGFSYDSKMKKLTQDQKDAYNFYKAVNNGEPLPQNNAYTKQHVQEVNGLMGVNSTSIKINFDDNTFKRTGFLNWDWVAKDDKFTQTGYQMLKQSLLKENIDLDKYATYANDNGKESLTIAKDNPYYTKIMMALNDVDYGHSTAAGGTHMTEKEAMTKRFNIQGIDNEGNIINRKDGAKDAGIFTKMYQGSVGADVNQNHPYEGPTYGVAVANAKRVWESAENNQIKNNLPEFMSTTMIPVGNAKQAEYYKQFHNGEINKSTYDEYVSGEDDFIENQLANGNLVNFNIWTTGTIEDSEDEETKGRFNKVELTNDRLALDREIKGAIGQKRLKFALTVTGNKIGTTITILPKKNEKGEIVEKGRQLFVENFQAQDVESVFNQDTNLRAVKRLNEAQYYGYDVELPNLGDDEYAGSITDITNDGCTFTDIQGQQKYIGREEAQKLINRQLILEDGIVHLNQNMFDEDGNLYSGTEENLRKFVEQYTESALREMYPDTFQSIAEYSNMNDNFNRGLDLSYLTNFIANKRALVISYLLNGIGLTANNNN